MKALAAVLAVAACWPAAAQEQPAEPVTVTTTHPRLLLSPQRLRLLRRERERASPRWEQFSALVTGNAQMPERGFALALYYRISADAAAGRDAVAFALSPEADLRQQALVYDWCQDLLGDAQRSALAARLEKAITAPPADATVALARSRALAAIALFDDVAGTPQRELNRLAHQWWGGEIVPALKAGRDPISRDDAYPLYEMLHALRDSTLVDLRETAPEFFKQYPLEHLVSYYPAAFQGPEGPYFIGASRRTEPDWQGAALSRAAELAMVAYDPNGASTQLLQGWLMHDAFMLRGPFGIAYEFLWANPYQPGLSYDRAPLVFHDIDSGKLFIRSKWDESAKWFGDFDGVLQYFRDGRLEKPASGPLALEQAMVCFAKTADRFVVMPGEDEDLVFLVELAPRAAYEVEIDDEEMLEAETDPGGILELEVPTGKAVGIRLRRK